MAFGGLNRLFHSVSCVITLALVVGLSCRTFAQQRDAQRVKLPPRGGNFARLAERGRQSDHKLAASSADPIFQYYGGPVISNAEIVVVLWGSNVDPTIASGMGGFYQTVLASQLMDLLSEYSTVGLSSGTSQAIGHGTVKGTYSITPTKANSGTSLADSMIQGELVYQIVQGNLPAPTFDAQNHLNTIYMIYFPPGVVITGTNGTSCVDFCGYHSVTVNANLYMNRSLYYGIFPDFGPNTGCYAGCGGAPSEFDKMTSVSTHELAETVTDAFGAYVQYKPPGGWYSSTYKEIGDICNGEGSIGPSGYWVQLIWSNLQGECTQAPPQFALSVPATITAGTPFDLQVTAEDSFSYPLTGYTGTASFASSDGAAVLPSNYGFGGSSSISFSVTLMTAGAQTITVSDARVPAMKGTITVEVTPPVSVTVAASPAGASFAVDGTNYSSTQILQWAPGSTHIVSVASPQAGAPGEQLTFAGWSDGGEATHVVVAPATPASYTVYFTESTAPQRPGRTTRPSLTNTVPATQATTRHARAAKVPARTPRIGR